MEEFIERIKYKNHNIIVEMANVDYWGRIARMKIYTVTGGFFEKLAQPQCFFELSTAKDFIENALLVEAIKRA